MIPFGGNYFLVRLVIHLALDLLASLTCASSIQFSHWIKNQVKNVLPHLLLCFLIRNPKVYKQDSQNRH